MLARQSETILHTAAEKHCDLITLGAWQVTGFKRLMVGGTSNAVSAKAQQPVVVVKHPPTPIDTSHL
jgi:nucleotide-binding universal stress UspA family protein